MNQSFRVPSGSYLYKDFKRLIDKWPIEQTKSRERNLRFLLKKKLQNAFSIPSASTLDDDNRVLAADHNVLDCKKRLEGITQYIYNMQYA